MFNEKTMFVDKLNNKMNVLHKGLQYRNRYFYLTQQHFQ